ncbi:MAG: hypothetical protein M3328_16810 [Chloroflexota bacterium]|nr:hypothetical protein [Chloroflexota bacterium]
MLRQRQRGKHKWKPVTSDWQIQEAKQQKSAYLVHVAERARVLHRRPFVSVPKRRQLQKVEEN